MVEQIVSVITGAEVIALLGLMAANVILSIVASISKGVFSFRNLPDFVPNRVLPLIGYIIVALLASFSIDWVVVQIACYVGLVAMYSAGVLAALKSITGLSLPNILTEKK